MTIADVIVSSACLENKVGVGGPNATIFLRGYKDADELDHSTHLCMFIRITLVRGVGATSEFIVLINLQHLLTM